MSVRHCCRQAIVAAALLGCASGAVLAAEVPAVFDVQQCKADYPERSRLNQEEGDIRLSVLVTAEGKVVDVKIEKSTGFRDLDKAAVIAAARCQVVPGSKDGSAVESWTTVHYSWKL